MRASALSAPSSSALVARWQKPWALRWSSATRLRFTVRFFANGSSMAFVIANEFAEALPAICTAVPWSKIALALFLVTIVVNAIAQFVGVGGYAGMPSQAGD